MGARGEVVALAPDAGLRAAEKPLEGGAQETPAENGLLGGGREGGRGGEGGAEEGEVAPRGALRDELEGGVRGEHVAELGLAVVVDAGDDPELVGAVEQVHARGDAAGLREGGAGHRAPEGAARVAAGDVAEDGRAAEGEVGVVDVGVEGLCGVRKAHGGEEGEVGDGGLGMPPVAVDVEVAAVAGRRAVGEPGADERAFGGVRPGGGVGGRQLGERRGRRREPQERVVDADVEVEDEVRFGEGDGVAHRGEGGGVDGAALDGLAGEGARLLDELPEAGEAVDAREVLVLRNGVRISEAEADGLFEFREGEAALFAVGEGAGEVVVPGGVAGQDLQGRAAGRLHRGDVAPADGVDQLLAQKVVAGPHARVGPGRKRLLLAGEPREGRGEHHEAEAKRAHGRILAHSAPRARPGRNNLSRMSARPHSREGASEP